MAERRMFSRDITNTDAFLDMPPSTQNLYFHLGMEADDEGFISSPRKVLRSVGANQNDLDILIAKKYLILFESGIVVVKHWKLNNTLRKDRLKETVYIEEKSLLLEKSNGAYTLKAITYEDEKPNDNQVVTKSQHSIVESRVVEDSIVEDSIVDIPITENELFMTKWEDTPFTQPRKFTDGRKQKLKTRLKTYKIDELFEKLKSQYNLASQDWFDIDWVLKNDENWEKLLNEKYKNMGNSGFNNKPPQANQTTFVTSSENQSAIDEFTDQFSGG